MLTSLSNFPRQKLPTNKKTDKWQNECVDALLSLSYSTSGTNVRATKREIIENYNLWNGVLDEDAINWAVNPFGLSIKSFPANIPHYFIINNKLKILIGEELRRGFDYTAYVVNSDAVSEKLEYVKKTIIDNLLKVVTEDEEPDPQKYQEKAAKVLKWAKYEAFDLRERVANQLLKYIYIDQKLKFKFNQGFKDLLIAGEEIYKVDILGKKLVVRKCDPRNIIVLGLTDSPFIEDAEAIIEEYYKSVSSIIDDYYDYLTEAQIDQLEKKTVGSSDTGDSLLNYTLPDIDLRVFAEHSDGTISTNDAYSYYDSQGNVKVSVVTWKTRRKVGILQYYDEYGYSQRELVDENYVPNPALGEEVKWFWVNEWFEKTKIGSDIYIKGGPVSIQPRDMDNISISMCPYVGIVYNTNNLRAKSLLSMLKPYSYFYDVIAYRLDKAIAKYQGPMIEMDFAKMPEGWTPEKWLYQGYETGYLYIDSFNESNKPHLRGVLGGHFNTTNKVINPDMGNYIKDLLTILQFIQDEISIVSGVSRQREGAIDARESVGGVERSVTQSSMNTEDLFFVHSLVKIKVMEVVLEFAKYVYPNNNTIIQYIADSDLAREILEIDGGLFSTANYGVVISNNELNKSKETIKELAKTALSAQVLNFSKVVDILMSDSLSDTRRKLEQYEDEMLQIQAKNAEEAQKIEMQKIQKEEEAKEKDRQLKYDLEKLKSDTDLEIKLLELEIKEKELALKEKEIELKANTDIELLNNKKDIDTKAIENKKEEIELKKEQLRTNNKNIES